jgi:hypothetical protein
MRSDSQLETRSSNPSRRTSARLSAPRGKERFVHVFELKSKRAR